MNIRDREIKFRIWSIHYEEMCYPADPTPNGDWKESIYLQLDGKLVGSFRGSEHTEINKYYEVMQYTGLKDMNGKEIYEGDIVKWTHPMEDIGTVEYTGEYDKFTINMAFYYLNVKRLGCCPFQVDDEYEIIGNIFENPKLLK